jgi:glutamate/tyrosine decarboxylase-like PLP-dependent enzyme
LTDILLQAEQKQTSNNLDLSQLFHVQNNAKLSEIAIIASEDTHYSIPKAANLLMLDWLNIPVDFTRLIDVFCIRNIIINAKEREKEIFLLSFQIWNHDVWRS